MAWIDVEPEPFTNKAPFVKASVVFPNIGDKFVGIYEGDEENTTGKFAGGRNFYFNTAGGRLAFTFSGKTLIQIQKCELRQGNLFAMQLRDKKDIGKENPMMIYLMKVDHDFKGAPPKNGPNIVIPVREQPAAAPAAPSQDDPFA